MQAKQITPLTDEILRAEALRLLSGSDSHTVLPVVELPDEWEYVVGELYVFVLPLFLFLLLVYNRHFLQN